MDKLPDKLWLPEDCDSVLCALSGGADSVCLLHALWTLSKARGFRLCAAHFDHGIRGEEAKRDAAFAEELCAKLVIPFLGGEGDVPQYAKQRHLGTEEAARQLRYDFLEKAADELSCRYIATAHNADDHAETVLFNLTRGSGAKGLCGIPRQRGRLIRPLLDVTRAEIEAYLAENALAHVEDSTNESDDYSRNLLRHRVLPVLRELNPALSAAIGRSSALLRQDEDYFLQKTEEMIRSCFDGESFPCAVLLSEHPALSSRVIRRLAGVSLSEKHVHAVLELCKGSGTGFADLPNLRVRRERGRVYFTPGKSVSFPERALILNGELAVPELGKKISLREGIFSEEVYNSLNIYYLKYEKMQDMPVCSARRNGDRFHPAGRDCGKTLKSLFNEGKLTKAQRDSRLVLRDAEGIVLVEGFGIDRRFACEKGDRCIIIEIKTTNQGE